MSIILLNSFTRPTKSGVGTLILNERVQVAQSLRRIGKIEDPEVEETVESNPLGYRNKVVFPFGRNAAGRIKAGYYQKGTHKIINLNQCPVQDERLNDLLPVIKADLAGFQIYDETKKTGDLRFLSLRIGQRTNEVLVTLVSTRYLDSVRPLAAKWMEQFPNIAGVCLNINCSDSNKIFGTKTALLKGRGYVVEICSGLCFRISSTAFFQVNTPQAETMISIILRLLNIEGRECIVDGYSGIGTMVLPIAQRYPNARCLAVDSHAESIECAKQNAALNGISNVQFQVGRFEQILPGIEEPLDVAILDPPRKGCAESVLHSLLQKQPKSIIYVSCNPATLARDINLLCQDRVYKFDKAIPIDLFPQTSHVETVALLKRVPS